MLTYLPDGNGVLVNLGFGIGVVEAVGAYDLRASDFAPTDLTIEMLYLVEAKSAAMEASRDLNRRLQSAKRTAEQQAQTDPLTGARNRRALDAELGRMIEARIPFGLVHVDLDYFKAVNDTLGHAAGDHVLKTVAQILSGEIRSGDIISRVGGDEFVLVLPDITTKAAIDALARADHRQGPGADHVRRRRLRGRREPRLDPHQPLRPSVDRADEPRRRPRPLRIQAAWPRAATPALGRRRDRGRPARVGTAATSA